MTATTNSGSFGDLLDPAHRPDPYPMYARMRAAGPARVGDLPVVVLTRFADCQALLRAPDASVDRGNSLLYQRYRQSAASELSGVAEPRPSFLFLDPPDHTRLRRLVSSAFTARVVARLAPRVRELVDGLIDAAAARGRVDLMADLAYPLPVAVICQMLGVPIEDEPRFHHWSGLVARSLDPVFAFSGAVDGKLAEQFTAAAEMREYFRDLIGARRREPGEDLLSALIAVEESGDVLTEEELISTCALLLIAGHETTVNLIGNAALALLRDPQWIRALREDTALADSVVEETLRYDPPVQMITRIPLRDTAWDGVSLRTGDVAVMLLGAAHRDPDAFAEPETFNPLRTDVRHIAFGLGHHFCLGAPLARLEGRLALTRFAQRVVEPCLGSDTPPYKENFTLRGLAALPVEHAGVRGADTPW